MIISKEAIAQTEQARKELTAINGIVDALEPYEIDKRTQILAAVICLESIEAAKAAIAAFQRAAR